MQCTFPTDARGEVLGITPIGRKRNIGGMEGLPLVHIYQGALGIDVFPVHNPQPGRTIEILPTTHLGGEFGVCDAFYRCKGGQLRLVAIIVDTLNGSCSKRASAYI